MHYEKSIHKGAASGLPWTAASAAALLLTALSGCGGGGGMSMSAAPAAPATPQACTSAACGTTLLSLTDAAGDFLQYKVKLVSLELVKADQSVVETRPAATTVDFAQLVDLSEIISTRQIPAGEYVAANVTLDFTDAAILVDDGTGTGVAVKPVDAAGAAIGPLKLVVHLDVKHDLKVTAGAASQVAFDFNLLASNTVDLTAATVTVSPVLAASVAPAQQKPLRVRGTLTAVDAANADYTVAVRPFHDGDDDKQSTLLVTTTDTTAFEINGTPFLGAAGLTQLATLPLDTITVAFGTVGASDRSFTASRVLAGSSVPGVGMDHIVGNVVARTGHVLTVHGAHRDGHDGGDDFIAGDTSVTIADATAVTVEGQTAASATHTAAEISIGSRIEAFGTASQTPATSTSPATSSLDATAGRVRLDLTRVQGVVGATGAGSLTLDLRSIDRQPVALFHFAGTGAAGAQDSDPAHYVLDTGALDLTPFPAGQSTLGIGFVTAFGAAPPDFTAITLATGTGNGSGDGGNQGGDDHGGAAGGDTSAKLELEWGDAGATAPFKTLDATHLELDIANPAIQGTPELEVADRRIDFATLAGDPTLVADSTGTGAFVIAHRQSKAIDNFDTFGDFEAALAADLNGTTTARKLTAMGSYDATTNAFTARGIVVLLND